LDGQAVHMGVEKLLHRHTRVIPCPVLHHKNMLCRLRQDIEQKSRIAFGVEASRMALKEKSPRKIIDEPKDLVGLARAAGRDFGLLASGRPAIAQRAPLGKAGFIAKEQQRFSLPGLAYNPRPRRLTPLQTLGLIEVSRDKAGLLIGK